MRCRALATARTCQPEAGPCGIAGTLLAVHLKASMRELWPAGQAVPLAA